MADVGTSVPIQEQANQMVNNDPSFRTNANRAIKFPTPKDPGIVERAIQGIENVVKGAGEGGANLLKQGVDKLSGQNQQPQQQPKTNPNIPGAGNMGGKPTPPPNDLLGLNAQKPADLMPPGFKNQGQANVIPDLPAQQPSAVAGQQSKEKVANPPPSNDTPSAQAKQMTIAGTGQENPADYQQQVSGHTGPEGPEMSAADVAMGGDVGKNYNEESQKGPSTWDTLINIAKMTGKGIAEILGNTGLIYMGQPSISQVKAGYRQQQILQHRQQRNALELAKINNYWESKRQVAMQEFQQALESSRQRFEKDRNDADRAMRDAESMRIFNANMRQIDSGMMSANLGFNARSQGDIISDVGPSSVGE